MICYLRNSNRFIDLSDPKPYPFPYADSSYPFGFTVLHTSDDWSICNPDRCEYLLTRLIDPKPLQTFLANWQSSHPELAL